MEVVSECGLLSVGFVTAPVGAEDANNNVTTRRAPLQNSLAMAPALFLPKLIVDLSRCLPHEVANPHINQSEDGLRARFWSLYVKLLKDKQTKIIDTAILEC